MSRISKRKLIKALKGDLEVKMTKEDIFEQFKNPPTQKEWLKGLIGKTIPADLLRNNEDELVKYAKRVFVLDSI